MGKIAKVFMSLFNRQQGAREFNLLTFANLFRI